MMNMRRFLTGFTAGLFILLAFGCSNAQTISPFATTTAGELSSPVNRPAYDSQRFLWGMWDINLDLLNLTANIQPVRNSQGHYNITQMILPPACEDCLEININSFDTVTRILDVDVTLHNPYMISGRDIRGILFTDDAGHELRNADDWTSLYDIPGGLWLNPLIAFAKGETDRIFAGGAEHTEKYLVYIPSPPQYQAIKYAVDASWPGNCREPYELSGFSHDVLYDYEGAGADLSVEAYDWQDNVSKITLVAPEITGENFTQLSYESGTQWHVMLKNNEAAPPGDYEARLIAASEDSGTIALYDFVTITISEWPDYWAQVWGGPEQYDNAYDISVDTNGNIYVTGRFQGTVDFDPGAEEDLRVSNGETDIFLSKFNNNGVFQWARTWGGDGNENGLEVATDSLGNVYVCGYFRLTVDFDPGAGTDNHTATGSSNACLSKFNPGGNFLWARTWGGNDMITPSGLGVDQSNDVYIAGYFLQTVDFNPGADTDERTSAGGYDVFLSKIDSDGNYQWAKVIGSTGWEMAFGLDVDDTDNIYFTGYFFGTVDFDPGIPTDEHISAGSYDAFLAKFDKDGDHVWARTWGGPEQEKCYSVKVTGSGIIFVTGTFQGTADLDPSPGNDPHTSNGEMDVFISRFNQMGDFYWARTWGSDADDYGYNVDSGSSGNAYVVGMFQKTCDFNPGVGVNEYTSNGEWDIYLNKISQAGDYVWTRTWGGTGWDSAQCIAKGSTPDIYIAGQYEETVDFNPGAEVTEYSSNGADDAFLLKLTLDGTW